MKQILSLFTQIFLPSFSLLADLPVGLYLPALWLDAHVVLSPPMANKIGMLVTLPDMVVTIGIVIVCTSLLGVVICVLLRVRNIVLRRRNKQFEQVTHTTHNSTILLRCEI